MGAGFVLLVTLFGYNHPLAKGRIMARTSRRTLFGAVPAAALVAPAALRQAGSAPAPARKRVYRKLTPTSKTFEGQPLYSPELTFGNLVFVSGKGGGTGTKADITAQTSAVLDQIEESLKIAGSAMDKVLKVNVYLTDIANFEGMNKAYLNRFGPEPPVRTTVAVSALPDGSLVEIDCMAHL
jgi:enamine deaminase RidA (YjgF/YER057c/UK114 family)